MRIAPDPTARWLLAGFLVALAAVLLAAGAARALSGSAEIPVNTTAPGDQIAPVLATDPGGGFTVAWSSYGQDGSESGGYARRFDAAGAPTTAEIPLNTTTMFSQTPTGVIADPGGGFTAVWYSVEQDGDGLGIYARRFDAAGNPLTAEIPVNTTTAGWQDQAQIVATPGGGFAVVWVGDNQDGDLTGLALRRFSAGGVPLTAEIPVNSTAANTQDQPAFAALAGGGFAIAWRSYNQDGDVGGVFARRFDASGTPITAEIPVNLTTASEQSDPVIAPDSSGGFTVAWESDGQDGSDSGIYARRFAGSGAPQTGEIPVNLTTVGGQREPTVAADPDNGFTVAWASPHAGPDFDIYARRFDAAGNPLGVELPVSLTAANAQLEPGIVADDSGGFTVAWTDSALDGDGSGIFARRFAEPTPDPESGPGPEPPATATAPGPTPAPKLRPARAACRGKQATIRARGPLTRGTKRRDVIVGTPRRDVIRGRGGNDLICGRGGGDLLLGGPGRDRLLGEGGRDALRGQGGGDALFGGRGPDRLFGGPGGDLLRGGPGLDRLLGGPGRDRPRGHRSTG